MERRNIVILGATGSIGKSALEVIARHEDRFHVTALAAYRNAEMLARQFHRFHPRFLCLIDPDAAEQLRRMLDGEDVTILSGVDEMLSLTRLDDVSMVLNAIVGAAGLRASLATLKNDKDLALANKESLVAGGPLFKSLLARSEGKLLPIDSEHSAIWQATRCGHPREVRKILLTSSGGPFRTWPKEKFSEITVEAALNHPTWKMGPKITIDSATLANKGLEVIEAVYLFEVAPEQIEVVIHPQSVIHSMVEFTDSSTIAQLSLPDMRLPITYALFFPERVESDFGRIDWQELSSLTFEAPDMDRFPALRLAYQAVRTGGTAPAVYNAANEVAVAGFLEGVVSFTSISDIIADTLDELVPVTNPELDDILEADRKARDIARRVLEKVT